MIFRYNFVEHIKIHTCTKFHDHLSKKNKVMTPQADGTEKAHMSGRGEATFYDLKNHME